MLQKKQCLSRYLQTYYVFISREPFIILSGGLSYDTVGRRPCLTVMHGKSTAVLEMDYSIVDFLTLCETPYPNGKTQCTSILTFKGDVCCRKGFPYDTDLEL